MAGENEKIVLEVKEAVDAMRETVEKYGVESPQFKEMEDKVEDILKKEDTKAVVLEWFNHTCPVCARHGKAKTMSKLVDKYKDKGVVWFAINSTSHATPAGNQAFAARHKPGRWPLSEQVPNRIDSPAFSRPGALARWGAEHHDRVQRESDVKRKIIRIIP